MQLHPGYDRTIGIPISQGGVIHLLSLSWVATAGSLGLAVLLLLSINYAQPRHGPGIGGRRQRSTFSLTGPKGFNTGGQ